MSQAGGYEKKDVNLKKVVMIGLSIVLFLVISFIGLNEYFLFEKEAVIQEQVLEKESVKLKDLRAVEEEILNSYQLLVDSTKVAYRIPLERAIEIMATEGANSNK